MVIRIEFNRDYLKNNYKEMMAVNDAPLPMFPLATACPEVELVMIERVCSEGPDSLYGRLRNGYFDKKGESYIETCSRLLNEYVEKHPEHSDLLKKEENIDNFFDSFDDSSVNKLNQIYLSLSDEGRKIWVGMLKRYVKYLEKYWENR